MSTEPNDELMLKPLASGKRLTPAHEALIKLLARQAVEDYLKEQEGE